MNTETKLDVLTQFSNHRSYIMDVFTPIVEVHPTEDTYKGNEVEDSRNYMESLLEQPISKISKFSDTVWDFNSDYPSAARNIQGSKLRLDFSRYEYISEFVLIEIKVILKLALLNNSIFHPKKGRAKRNLKANSLFAIFKYGLSFIDEIFKHATDELGYEFVQKRIKTLVDVTPSLYYKAAKKYNRAKGPDLDKFFAYLRSPASISYVFKKPIPYVELKSLDWKKVQKVNTDKVKQVLPDHIFESMSKLTSYIVIDFLRAIGDEEKISDVSSLERFKTSTQPSWANKEGVNRQVLNGYTALRLRNKGYSSDFIKGSIESSDWMLNTFSDILNPTILSQKLRDFGCEIDNLRSYFNIVGYSCMYIIGQYTAMRPSELSEVRVNDCTCLVEDNGVWLIESVVKKHKDEIHTSLFDDRWVAIPIVRDSVLAASYISKIKASPYLASNVDTVSPNKSPLSLSSSGIKYQIEQLIDKLLGKEILEATGFIPYMLRHTLAYQLYRAEVGLPLISFQLKHFVDSVSKYTSQGAMSAVTLGYGEIGDMLSKGEGKAVDNSLRKAAELEAIKAAHNPNAIYYGGKAEEHKNRLTKVFKGYMAEGYTEDEIYEAMADQGVAVVYMSQGLCYGGRKEDYDSSLPCIGSLRCNPARCKQAVVTSKHAPKWREIYLLNKANLNKPEYAHNREQILAALNEARMVLESLNEEVEI